MNKIATYLQGHLRGDVLVGLRARSAYARDGSILSAVPDAVVRPHSTNDTRKVARFAWQLAEKGHALALTLRGGGNDMTGAAVGSGIMVDFMPHMHKILEVDTKQRLARVQPGVVAQTLNEALLLHGVCLPPLLSAEPTATIGGAIATNFAGSNSVKYGVMSDWIQQLEVVLANGEVIQTGRINKKELNKKKGLATFEGELYRAVDGIITDGVAVIDQEFEPGVVQSLGYNIGAVKRPDGSFDLTPLFTGSQGTLGLITEMIVKLLPHTPQTDTVVVTCASLEAAHDAIDVLRMAEPAEIELLDEQSLVFASKYQGISYADILGEEAEMPKIVLFAVLDDSNDRVRHKKAKKIEKALTQAGNLVLRSEDFEIQLLWRRLYERTVSAICSEEADGKVPTPLFDDVLIPADQFEHYMSGVQEFAAKHRIHINVWGSAAAGAFHIRPLLDMRRLSDRQKIFRLIDEYTSLIMQLGGIFASRSGEGRLLAPFIKKIYPTEVLELFNDIKKSFDPYDTLNTGVKTEFDPKKIVALVADDYSPYR